MNHKWKSEFVIEELEAATARRVETEERLVEKEQRRVEEQLRRVESRNTTDMRRGGTETR